MAAMKKSASGASRAPVAPPSQARMGLPWGQGILREAALGLLRSGAVAPSAVMGNLLAASAQPGLDVELLSARPRPLSAEANRIVADALRRYRLPQADTGAILEELMALVWVRKESSAAQPGRLPSRPSQKAGPARAAPIRAPSEPAKAPIIVRRGTRLSKGES